MKHGYTHYTRAAVTIAAIAMASVLHSPMGAQETGVGPFSADFDSTLVNDVTVLSGKAVRDNVISAGRRDSILTFVNDSIPKDSPALRITVLKGILSRIDDEYDKAILPGSIFMDIPKELIMSMIPSSLPVPETFVDKNRKKLAAQINGITAVKTDIARSLAASLSASCAAYARCLYRETLVRAGNAAVRKCRSGHERAILHIHAWRQAARV